MRFWKLLVPVLASSLCFAAQSDRITGTIDSGQRVTLTGQIHRKAKPQYDQGRVLPSLRLDHVNLLTLPTASQQKALRLLVSEQQNPKSANFRKWITPEQYAERFGLSENDIRIISGWLKSQGLSVVTVARGRNWIEFSGTAAQIESAFRTEIHHYNVDGETHFANATAPSIPAALSGIVTGFRGLDDFHPEPMYVRNARARSQRARHNYYDGNFQIPDFVAPGDIATIYDIQTLYNTGFDGTGQKMVIVGQTDVYLADLNAFRTGFGLPLISGCSTDSSGVITNTACNTSNFVYVLDGTDPGVASTARGDVTEADLDLEWSAATARGAQIIFVNSTDVFHSFYYAIDQNLAPVISMSYGAPCEFDDNTLSTDETELTKANSFGITFMNSSGDSGAASCDPGPTTPSDNLAVGGLAVSYPASSPEVTAVGGTAVDYSSSGFSSTYWTTTNGTNGGTAQNPPLPEISWNDDVELTLPYGGTALSWQESYAIVSSGGGVSNCSVQTSDFSNCVSGFAQPSWQTVTIPGQAGGRFVPDVSLLASPNFPGYVYCTPIEELATVSPYTTETTSSCGSGTATEITNSVNGIPGSNPNQPDVFPSIVGGTSASSPIFAGIVTMLNQYLGTSGMGNINPVLYALAQDTSTGAFHQVKTGTNVVYCEGGQPPAPWPAALQCPGAAGTTGSFGYNASNADTATGYNLVTGLGSVDVGAFFVAAATLPDFTLAAGPPVPSSVPAGQSATVTINVTPINPSSGMTINFSDTTGCAGLPTGGSCKFSPNSVNGAAPSSVQLTIFTPPNMAPASLSLVVSGTASGTSTVSRTIPVSLTVTATTESFTLTPTNGSTFTLMVGGTASVALTVNNSSSSSGFIVGTGAAATTAVPLTYTCTGVPALAPAEISCQLPNAGQPDSATAVTVNLVTTPVTTQLRPPMLGRQRGMFVALLLPGLLGIVFVAGKGTRGLRLLGLIVVLGFSTVWLGSCGGSNNSNNSLKNPGTPPGTYMVTISATTGGGAPLTNSTSITFKVTQLTQ